MEFPPLEFDHYSVAPEIMWLKNTGKIPFKKNNIFWLSGQVLELTMVPFSPQFSPTLSGGGLSEKYKLAKIVFHWGVMSGSGVNSFVLRPS